jgi:hypothetical protein
MQEKTAQHFALKFLSNSLYEAIGDEAFKKMAIDELYREREVLLDNLEALLERIEADLHLHDDLEKCIDDFEYFAAVSISALLGKEPQSEVYFAGKTLLGFEKIKKDGEA